MIDLGTLGGTWSAATAIDDAGQVGGWSATQGDAEPHPFLYSNGVMVDLGAAGGGSLNYYNSSSDNGKKAFWDFTPDGALHAFLSSNGTAIDLGTLGGTSSVGLDVNDSAHVVGWSYTTAGVIHGFVYLNDVMADLNQLVDPLLGWRIESANAINNLGYIAADGYNSQGIRHAILLTPISNAVSEPPTVALLSLCMVLGALVRRFDPKLS